MLKIDEGLKEKILTMIERAKPSEEVKKEIIKEWREYFTCLDIGPSDQDEEFLAIVRMRLQVGQISLRAPDIEAFMKGYNVIIRR